MFINVCTPFKNIYKRFSHWGSSIQHDSRENVNKCHFMNNYPNYMVHKICHWMTISTTLEIVLRYCQWKPLYIEKDRLFILFVVNLFGILRHFLGRITAGCFGGRGDQSTQLVSRFCSVPLPTNGKQLPAFTHKVQGLIHWPPRWESSVLPLPHCAPPPSIWVSLSMKQVPINVAVWTYSNQN